MSEKEFFIGWQGKAPEGIGRFFRGQTILIVLFVMVVAAVIAASQATIGLGRFEFGKTRSFEGVLIAKPVPTLITAQPDDVSGTSVYTLVNPFKFGFDADMAAANHLKTVKLEGTLIYQPEDGQAMIEVVPGTVAAVEGGAPGTAPAVESLGTQTLRGEIVDSKCYLGVMNPGLGKAHRACAIRCVSGGIPPVLLTWDRASGKATYYLFVGEDGEPINDAVLDAIALPVEITGEVERVGRDRLVLKAAPEDIRILE